jgi:small subunit ribosomal protein S6
LRHYELVVVLSPMLNQDQAADTWSRIKGFINNREAEITHEENWGTRRLAYAIRKGPYRFQEGNYHLTRFSAETPFNQELETFLRLDEQVLRSMVVATEAPKPVVEPPPAPVVVEEAVSEAPAEAEVSSGTEAADVSVASEDASAPGETEAPVASAEEPAVEAAPAAPAAEVAAPEGEIEAPAAEVEAPEAVVEAPVVEDQEPVLEDLAEVAAPEAEASEAQEGDQPETAATEESPR